MKRALRMLFLLAVAVLAGAATSEAIYRIPETHSLFGRFLGIEAQNASSDLALRAAAESEPAGDAEIERELALLRFQFGDENSFAGVLTASHLSLGKLRMEIRDHLRARRWIEKQIAPQLAVTPAEPKQFYEEHAAQFLQPQRYRCSHLFLAAPARSTLEIIAGKQGAIQGLAVRMLAGESLAQLIAEASEDEATNGQGGDLNYFAATRMPAEFLAEVEKLQPGSATGPLQSHLGFHILQLTEVKPPEKLTFEQAQSEIARELMNRKRVAAVTQLRARLAIRNVW